MKPAYFTIPGCRSRFYPDEGHLSLILNQAGEILESLIV